MRATMLAALVVTLTAAAAAPAQYPYPRQPGLPRIPGVGPPDPVGRPAVPGLEGMDPLGRPLIPGMPRMPGAGPADPFGRPNHAFGQEIDRRRVFPQNLGPRRGSDERDDDRPATGSTGTILRSGPGIPPPPPSPLAPPHPPPPPT